MDMNTLMVIYLKKRFSMKTINLTDEQFDTLYEFVDNKVESIVNASVDYNDSEILNEWEDLLDIHTILGETNQ